MEQMRQDHELQLQKMRQEHELQMEMVKQKQIVERSNNMNFTADMPTLPVFDDKQDNIDSYMDRFERFATVMKWKKSEWATILSCLLTGKSLEVYTRLSDNDATSYDKIKAALRKRYNLTEEGYRLKFRKSEPEESENPTQFVTRITKYLEKWMETAKSTDYEKLKILLIKEQFLNMCNKKLAAYLNEDQFIDMKEMCDRSERYIQAHRQKLTDDNQPKSERTAVAESDSNTEQRQSNTRQRQPKYCYNCGKLGHIRSECRNQGGGNEQQCSRCKRFGHLVETCRSSGEFTGMMQTKRWIRGKEKSYKRTISSSSTQMKQDKEQENKDSRHRLRPQKGIINGYTVDTLRDSGCTAICVNRKLVRADQFTGQYQTCTLMDRRETRLELARVNLNTPYIEKQWASVLCVKDLEYRIEVGDVLGARCKCDPNPNWNFNNDQDAEQSLEHIGSKEHVWYGL